VLRVAALYDVHGNLPALEAVMREIEAEAIDAVLVGGDVVSGPMPNETLELLRSLEDRVRFVRGNADRVLDFAGAGGDGAELERWKRARLWVAERLDADDLRFLDALPLDVVLDIDGLGRARFCHGAPGSDEEAITRLTPGGRLRRLLVGVQERIVVCGHTHVQFDRVVDGYRIVNAGSVGAPYEAEPGAYWLLLGPDVSLRRTPYDVAMAAERIRATGYPNLAYLEEMLVADETRPERMSALIERAA